MAKNEVVIREADPVEHIANRLIQAHHSHLADAKILYLFTSAKRKKCDRVRLGSAQKLSGLLRYLSSGTAASVADGYDFVVLIGSNEWRSLEEHQRMALVDHELSHCWRYEKVDRKGNTTDRWGLRGHDLEEFTDVVARHGLWRMEHKTMNRVMRQLRLTEAESEAEPAYESVELPVMAR